MEPLYKYSPYKPQENFTVIFPEINPPLPLANHRHESTLNAAFYDLRSDFPSFYAGYSRSGQNDHDIDRFKEIILGEKDKDRTVSGRYMSAIGK